jgi:hypothetical protein
MRSWLFSETCRQYALIFVIGETTLPQVLKEGLERGKIG